MNAAFAEQLIRLSNVNFLHLLYKANSMWSEGKDCVLSAYGKAIGQPIATIQIHIAENVIVAITPLCAARLIIPRIKHRKVLHLSDDGSRRSVIMVVSGKVILNCQKNVSCKIKSRNIVVNKENVSNYSRL
jgi:hypothetical protein